MCSRDAGTAWVQLGGVGSTGAVGPYVEAIFGVVAAVDGLGLKVVWSCDGVTLGEVRLGGK